MELFLGGESTLIGFHTMLRALYKLGPSTKQQMCSLSTFRLGTY